MIFLLNFNINNIVLFDIKYFFGEMPHCIKLMLSGRSELVVQKVNNAILIDLVFNLAFRALDLRVHSS